MPARTGDTVAVEYTGTLEDGTVFDSSEGRAPLLFTIGTGDVLADFEQAVVGLDVGGSITVTIPAEQAYGPYHDEAVEEVPIDVFGEGAPPLGGEYTVVGDDGEKYGARVTAISDDLVNATLDFNHPLAGHDLTFAITLVELIPTEAE